MSPEHSRHPSYIPLDKAMLETMYSTLKLSVSEMSRRFKVTSDTVRSRLDEYGITDPKVKLSSRRQLQKPLDETILRDAFKSMNIADMAIKFGVSAGTIRRNLDKYGLLPLATKLRTDLGDTLPSGTELDKLREKEFLSSGELADRFNAKEGTVVARINRALGHSRMSEAVRQARARIKEEDAKSQPKTNNIRSLDVAQWEKEVRSNNFFGEKGNLAYSDDRSQVQCHLCGRFLKWVSPTHLKCHGLEIDRYREIFDLNRNQPLLAPESSALRSRMALERDSVSQIVGLEEPFFSGDPRLQAGKPLRLQKVLFSQNVLNEKRKKGEPSRGRDGDAFTRRVDSCGTFSLWGEHYFSRLAKKVTIELKDGKIIATGILKDGSTFIRTYKSTS